MREGVRSELPGRRLEPRCVPGADRDLAAFVEQALRDRIAEAVTPSRDRCDPALQTEVQALSRWGGRSFGDRRHGRSRRAPAHECLFGLGIEQVDVAGVDRDLDVLTRLDI